MLGFLGLREERGVLILAGTGPIETDQRLRWRELINFRNSAV